MTWMALLLACSPAPLEVTVRQVEVGLEVRALEPLEEVHLLDPQGRVLDHRLLPQPTPVVWLAGGQGAGDFTVVARVGRRQARASVGIPAPNAPVQVSVQAPAGQGSRQARDGELVRVPLVQGGRVEAIVMLTALDPVRVSLELGGRTRDAWLPVPGARWVEVLELGREQVAVQVRWEGGSLGFTLAPQERPHTEARRALRMEEPVFPAQVSGAPDLARPQGRVTLPSRAWRSLLHSLGLGTRPRPEQAPWAWEAITLHNSDPADANLVLQHRVVDADGQPVPAFRPRLRELDGAVDHVSVLLRVPAGSQATATLPLYVDDGAIPSTHPPWYREVVVLPLGSQDPLYSERLPLHVSRGSSQASLGTALALLSGLGGLVWGSWAVGRLLRGARTSDLTTVAVFGSLTFVVSMASQLLGMALAAALGPFSPLVTGLVDDAFRTALLATLVTLLPRPGVVALALVLGQVMRGLGLGSFHPLDLVTLGSSIAFLETSLWATGLTRGGAWRDQAPWTRWVRMSLGFGIPSALSMLCALSVGTVFYRMFYAPWYVLLMVALPGFLYVVGACGIAVRFAASLRRVEA